MKKQVVVIHGGNTYKRYKEYLAYLKSKKINLDRYRKGSWKNSLQRRLGRNFDVLLLKMPNSANARYQEWKRVFRKIAPLLRDNLILIGNSLGGVFLAKYLSENKFPKKILASMLVAAPYGPKDVKEFLGNFVISNNLARFRKQGGQIFLFYSQDDPVVLFVDLEKYQKLLPEAVIRTFKKRGHFMQPEFPEIVREIKRVCRK